MIGDGKVGGQLTDDDGVKEISLLSFSGRSVEFAAVRTFLLLAEREGRGVAG